MITLDKVFASAVAHVADNPVTETAARDRLAKARELQNAGDLIHARRLAVESIRWSTGYRSAPYRRAVLGTTVVDDIGREAIVVDTDRCEWCVDHGVAKCRHVGM